MSKTSFVTAGLVVLALTVAASCAGEGEPADAAWSAERAHREHGASTARRSGLSSAELALHDEMRKLWEDHILWTRQFIVSVAHSLADADPTAQRLLANQVHIGDVFRRFYGNAVGDELTELLTDHILIAAELLVAARAGDADGVADANARWIANADQIAALWARINPRSWPLDEMTAHMREHLSLTLDEAVLRLNGDFAGDIARYEEVHAAILELADMLSDGIIRQFPRRFR